LQGINVIAAMATAFVAGYFVAGMYDLDDSSKLVAGLLCLVGMLFVEVILLMIYVYQAERELMPHEKEERRYEEKLRIDAHHKRLEEHNVAMAADELRDGKSGAGAGKSKVSKKID
jgi:hypothetical protein